MVSQRPEHSQEHQALKLALVVGARPQFIKLAPVCRAIAAASTSGQSVEGLVIHTGQHYDASMSDIFFDELEIPRADVHLGVGSGTHGYQTAQMLERLELTFTEHDPDMVLTFGDTNSTLAATLAAAKLHIPLGHVEAGLRSFNRSMPEESNRIVADHLSDLLFAPTPEAMRNLGREGLLARAAVVGDVMLDATRFNIELAMERSRVLERLGVEESRFILATVHRAENTDSERLCTLLDAFARIASPDRPVVFPVHPRTAKCIRQRYPERDYPDSLRMLAPLGYLDMIRLTSAAQMVLTDSGGLQKEAFFLGRPCVTLREETEWVETVDEGGNLIAGADSERILAAVSHWDEALGKGGPDWSASVGRVFGDGQAAMQVIKAASGFLESRRNA